MRSRAATSLVALSVFSAAVLGAQSPAPVDTIGEARRLRDAGDYRAAAMILAPYVDGHADDAGTARFAALMAYWSKDIPAARAVYERTLGRHPGDADLRVEYAQFLTALGETSRARTVITPLADSGSRALPATRRALTVLGTLDYWSGDYSLARKRFIETLRLDSTDSEARRQLRDIELAAASWIRVGGSGWHDDQPIDRGGFEAEGGWFATPLTPVTVRAATTRFSSDGQGEGEGETVSSAELTIATFFPRARMDVSVGGGLLDRTFADALSWTGRASLGFRLPRGFAVEGRVERAPYLHTSASLTTTVMTNTVDGTLRWRAPSGWMADATARRESFDDDNAITTGFVWLLAPVLRRAGGQLHVGYSFSAQAATNNRFVPRDEDLDFPPGQPPASVRGVYQPYYTPRDLRVHSAVVSTTVRPGPRWSLSTNGTLGVHAQDDAPVLIVVSRPPNADIARAYYRRAFTPWNLRGAVEGSATESVRLALTAEHGKGAYYAFTTVGARVTYTFVAAARRRANRH